LGSRLGIEKGNKMTLRAIASVVLGCIVWWFLFFAVGIAFGSLWPDYREAAHLMFKEGNFSHFSTPMLLLNLVVFIVAGLLVGWLVSLISKNRISALVVALLYLLYTAFNHYIVVWEKLPGWYNVVVPLIVPGSIVQGGRFARTVSLEEP
jgi:hypothetical protein